MSNILEQDGIMFIPVNRNLKVEDIVSRFFDFLQKRKTPADIYEEIKLHNLTLCYAAEYLAIGNFVFDWSAQLTFTNESTTKTEMSAGSGTAILNDIAIQEKMGFWYSAYHDGTDSYTSTTTGTSSQFDRGSGSGEVSAVLPGNVNELSGVSDKFFPTENEISEILDVNAFLNEPEFGVDAVYECQRNTMDYENVGMESLLDEKTYSQANDIINSKYSGIQHSINDINIHPNSLNIYSVLIPVWRIDYSYNGLMYTCFVNAHIHGKTNLFGGSEQCSGYVPEDESKTKGLINKVKATKEKKNYKKSSRIQYENYWIQDIKNRFL